MTVVVLDDAAADLEAGRRFYESREPGVGDYFLESLLSDLDSLVLYAGIHSRHFGSHRLLSKRFPFGIYYEVEGDTAYVYAILDMRQDPRGLESALQSRK
jgi:hypothetical protein